jgi:hypothetical protein
MTLSVSCGQCHGSGQRRPRLTATDGTGAGAQTAVAEAAARNDRSMGFSNTSVDESKVKRVPLWNTTSQLMTRNSSKLQLALGTDVPVHC